MSKEDERKGTFWSPELPTRVLNRSGPNIRDVRPCPWLADAEADELLSSQNGRHHAPDEFVRAKQQDRRQGHGVDGESEDYALGCASRDLVDPDQVCRAGAQPSRCVAILAHNRQCRQSRRVTLVLATAQSPSRSQPSTATDLTALSEDDACSCTHRGTDRTNRLRRRVASRPARSATAARRCQRSRPHETASPPVASPPSPTPPRVA